MTTETFTNIKIDIPKFNFHIVLKLFYQMDSGCD